MNVKASHARLAEVRWRILVESARRNMRAKRGTGLVRQELCEEEIAAPEPHEDLIALDEALEKLADEDRLAADLVQLRYFAGLPLKDAARSLGLAPRTAERLWAYARAWLHKSLGILCILTSFSKHNWRPACPDGALIFEEAICLPFGSVGITTDHDERATNIRSGPRHKRK